MSKKTKVWLTLAAAFIVIGSSLFSGVMMKLDWKFQDLATVQFVEKTYDISSAFTDINVTTDTTDVWFYHADDGKTKVVCVTEEKIQQEVAVIDGVLTITTKDTRAWYERIGISFKNAKIHIYLPEEAYKQLLVRTQTGSVVVSGGFTFDSIEISATTGDLFCWASANEKIKLQVTTGDIRLETAKAKSAELKSTTGDISLQDVILTDALSVRGNTGSVKLDSCDAENITVDLTTGAVWAKLRTPKMITAKSGTGKVKAPTSTQGGKCEITTDTGDITIEIMQ